MRRNDYQACTNTFADINLYYKDNIREGWFWKAQRFKTFASFQNKKGSVEKHTKVYVTCT